MPSGEAQNRSQMLKWHCHCMNCCEAFLPGWKSQEVQHTVYVFDGFHLDVTRRRLISSGGLVRPLNARAMDALLLLVINAGQLVEKRRLMAAVWPAAIVEDNNLNQCILAVRKALGEVAGSNRYIMTEPGRGYRFVCPVRVVMQESSPGELDENPPGPVPAALWMGIVLAVWAVAVLMMGAHFTRSETAASQCQEQAGG